VKRWVRFIKMDVKADDFVITIILGHIVVQVYNSVYDSFLSSDPTIISTFREVHDIFSTKDEYMHTLT